MGCGCNGTPKVKPSGAPCGCGPKSQPRNRLLDDIADFPILTVTDGDLEEAARNQVATLTEIMTRTDYPPPRTMLARASMERDVSSDCGLSQFTALRPTHVMSPLAAGVGAVIRERAIGVGRRNLRLQVLAPLWELTSVRGPRAPEAAPVACDPCEPVFATSSARLSCESQVGPDDSISEDLAEPPQQREQDADSRNGCTTDPCAASALAGGRPLLKAAEAGRPPTPSCPVHEPKKGGEVPVTPVSPNIRGKPGSSVPCPCTCFCIPFPRLKWPFDFSFNVNTVFAGALWFWQKRSYAMPDLLWLLDSMGIKASWIVPRASSTPGDDGDAVLQSIAGGFVPSMTPLVEGADLGLGRFTGLDLTALRPNASEPAEFTLDRERRVTLLAPTHPEHTIQARVPFSTPLSAEVAEDLALLSGRRDPSAPLLSPGLEESAT